MENCGHNDFLRRLLVETIGTHDERERSFPINIHRGTLGNAVERSLVVSRGKSNRSRRLQTRAAELQACMPGCIRVGVTEAALNPDYANVCGNRGEKCLLKRLRARARSTSKLEGNFYLQRLD